MDSRTCWKEILCFSLSVWTNVWNASSSLFSLSFKDVSFFPLPFPFNAISAPLMDHFVPHVPCRRPFNASQFLSLYTKIVYFLLKLYIKFSFIYIFNRIKVYMIKKSYWQMEGKRACICNLHHCPVLPQCALSYHNALFHSNAAKKFKRRNNFPACKSLFATFWMAVTARPIKIFLNSFFWTDNPWLSETTNYIYSLCVFLCISIYQSRGHPCKARI